MKTFALLVAVAFLGQAQGSEFTVVNKMPTVVNRMPATVTQTVTTYRNPVGHTHTCVNGHTWDHSANPTHRCQFCGATPPVIESRDRRGNVIYRHYVTDAPAKMVMETRTAQAPAPQPVIQAVPVTVYRMPQASSACVNGNCAYQPAGRFR